MGAAFPPSAKPLHLHTIHKLIELAVIIHDIHMPQWLPAYSHFKAKTMRPHGLLSHSSTSTSDGITHTHESCGMMHADSPWCMMLSPGMLSPLLYSSME